MSQPPMGPESQGPGVPPPGQPYGAMPPPPAGGQPPLTEADRKLWAMLGHLSGIILGFIGPLIVWLIYKDRDEFVKDQSQEALNFQITIIIAAIVLGIVTFFIFGLGAYLAVIAMVIFAIIGGLAANKGERYRYPFALRLIK